MRGECLLNGIQIKNCRSLKDTGYQKLSPITILVGENSSGKSTFLRTFPLIKQSLNKRISGPILWAGDNDDYVDFGSFEETVTNDGSDTISFKFFIPFQNTVQLKHFLSETKWNLSKYKKYNIQYEITLNNTHKEEVVMLQIRVDNSLFVFDLLKQRIYVDDIFFDGVHIKEPLSANSLATHFDELNYYSFQYRRRSQVSSRFDFSLPSINKHLINSFSNVVDFEKLPDSLFMGTIHDTAALIGELLCYEYKFDDILKIIDERGEESFEEDSFYSNYDYFVLRNIINYVNLHDSQIQTEYSNLFKLAFLYSIFFRIEEYIVSYFRQVHYIAPLRATAERYYRLRNLAVDEIDYQGKNLAIYINSLSDKRLRLFQQWTLEQFGFYITKKKSKGHISLNLSVEGQKKSINLSDTGFGYSQILPIITQLWDLSTRKDKSTRASVPLVIAIEQPELHLHPAVQAKLVDAFIACIDLARNNNNELQIILETHSETMVNRFGLAIARKKIEPSDVSIILFEKPLGEEYSKVKNSQFDEDGFLVDWPYGFFAAGD